MSRLLYPPKNINNTPANPFVIQNLTVTGNASIAGSLSAGATSVSSFSSGGTAVLNNATVAGTLNVNSLSTLGSLSVTGSTAIGGTLGVTGLSTLGSLAVTNNATVGGTLGVTGLSTLNNTTINTGQSLTVTNVNIVGMVFPLSLYVFTTETGTSRIASPYAGTIIRAYTNVWATMVGGDATLTMNIGGVAVTSGLITIPTGSAAGTINLCTPSGLNTVVQGSDINFTLSGPFNGPSCMITLLILRSA